MDPELWYYSVHEKPVTDRDGFLIVVEAEEDVARRFALAMASRYSLAMANQHNLPIKCNRAESLEAMPHVLGMVGVVVFRGNGETEFRYIGKPGHFRQSPK